MSEQETISVEELRNLLSTIVSDRQLQAPVVVGESGPRHASGLEVVKASIDFDKSGPMLLLETEKPESREYPSPKGELIETEISQITADDAREVLWFFGHRDVGYEPGSFKSSLISTISKADSYNRFLLMQGFPSTVRAVVIAQDYSWGVDELKKKAERG